jgi:hypothetical protein
MEQLKYIERPSPMVYSCPECVYYIEYSNHFSGAVCTHPEIPHLIFGLGSRKPQICSDYEEGGYTSRW